MDEDHVEKLKAAVAAALTAGVLRSHIAYGELAITIEPAHVVDAMTRLRDDPACRFICLIDVTAVDYPAREKRFDVVYHLLSPDLNQRLRVKAALGDGEAIHSICGVFPAADWFEREVYDLFGVAFAGHPDLRRILTDYGFDGHPLRKDFPMTGFVEVRYDDERKRVVNEPVTLTQEFRQFDFLSPWEGSVSSMLPGDEKASGAETKP